MDINDILTLYDRDLRQHAAIPGMRREVDGNVVRLVMEAESEGFSFISYSTLNETNADETIARQMAYFAGLGRGFEWSVYDHDRPFDLGSRLAAHGFEAGEEESVMVLELASADSLLGTGSTADVRRLQDPADLEMVRRLLEDVWGEEFSWFVPRMERFLTAGDYAAIFTAQVDGIPASTGWIFFPQNGRFAGLYGGSTLAQYRGRGLYTALVAARAQEAIRRGYQFLVIDAGEMSRPIVEKQGFRLLARATPYTMEPPGG